MIKRFSDGLLGSNTYVVYCEKSKNAMIVDCGCKPSKAVDFVNECSLNVKYIVLTHGHYDHAEYTGEFLKAFQGAELICHADEIQVLTDPDGNLSSYFDVPKKYPLPTRTVTEGDVIKLSEDLEFTVLHTPGHTPGGICLLCESEKVLLTGDVLFANSYGRVDFKYGDPSKMQGSLERLLRLPDDVTFYPGHYGEGKIGLWEIPLF